MPSLRAGSLGLGLDAAVRYPAAAMKMGNPSAKPIIGLLGAPGSGKSLVARQFAELGGGVIDADAIAKALLDEPAVKKAIVERFGDRVLGRDGHIDRSALGGMVFADRVALDDLQAIIHPRVHDERLRLRKAFEADDAVMAIVEDVPLLLETGLDRDCDALVFVETSEAIRRERVARHRGWSVAELARREKMQMPLDIKRRRADYVVNNDADAQATMSQVRRVLSRITHATMNS